MAKKDEEKLNQSQTTQKNSGVFDNHPFLHIHGSQKSSIFYIGEIRKLKSSFVVIELKNEGKNLLRLETIIKLSGITLDENRKRTVKNSHFFKSYFIINQHFASKIFIWSAIDTLLEKKQKAIIALDGNAASGKTTFSKLFEKVYDCNVFHVDHYFQKPMSHINELVSKYASHINFIRMENEIFNPIKNEQASKIKLMDLRTHTLSDSIEVDYKPLSILEGAYSMHPYIISNYDLKIFMKTIYLKQLFRIWKRNGFKKLIQFIKKWIPMENKYFHDLNIEKQADLIFKR